MHFLLFRIFEQLALALKNTVYPQTFHCIEYAFLSFRIFEQLALALENRVALEFFTVLNRELYDVRIFKHTNNLQASKPRVCTTSPLANHLSNIITSNK